MSQPFLNQTVELLYLTGERLPLKLDETFLTNCGFDTPEEIETFRIGHLRDYIFEDWEQLSVLKQKHGQESSVDSNKKPTTADQIQLLHLGTRLNPNELLSSLNIGLSPVIHIIIKPLDQLQTSTNEKWKFDLNKISKKKPSSNDGKSSKRRPSTSNAPVPIFSPAYKERKHSVGSTNHSPSATSSATTPQLVQGASSFEHQQPIVTSPTSTNDPSHKRSTSSYTSDGDYEDAYSTQPRLNFSGAETHPLSQSLTETNGDDEQLNKETAAVNENNLGAGTSDEALTTTGVDNITSPQRRRSSRVPARSQTHTNEKSGCCIIV